MFNNNHYYCSWIPYEFLRILSIFRGDIYCLSHATVAVDINMETWKGKGILLSQFTQNVVEACFLRNITGSKYLLGNWFKIKFPKSWPYFYVNVFPYITFIAQRTELCFEVHDTTMKDLT